MSNNQQHQEIFNIVWAHAQKKEKSIDEHGSCVYRGPKCTKCFLGALIKDKFYTEELESCLTDSAEVMYALNSSGFTHFETDFILEVQEVHDDFEVSDWNSQLNDLAEEYNLGVPTLS